MKKGLITLLIGLYFSSILNSQIKESDSFYKSKIESFIIMMQSDSTLNYISRLKDGDYKKLLLKIVDTENATYKDYNIFLTEISNKEEINYNLISNYINDFVKPPLDRNKINLDYTLIKQNQVTTLRNNGNLDEATTQNKILEDYINKFSKTDKQYKIQKSYVSIHNAVMNFIQKDFNKGKEILDNCLKIAREYNDIPLEIASFFYLSDFLVVERKLDEFIDVNERSLQLEKKQPSKTSYYAGTIGHLINAYAFKGGYDKRVEQLLEELYNDPISQKDSYSLYAQYLSTLDLNSETKKNIFKKFGSNNALEFCEIITEASKNKLNDNDFYHVLSESSKLLEKDNFYKEAIKYKDQAIVLTRKIYSEDLTKSLANFKTQQAIKSKEVEILNAKERSNLYIIIGSLVTGLFLISVFVIIKKRKQSKLLMIKNHQINDALKEKELLIKEVHHRVKNNFQIVSSLLELQSKDIEDEKALALASESQNRIKSMALIHQKLYQNENGLIDFDEYIRLLVKEISILYKSNTKIDTKIITDDLFFDIDTAIPLGLIVNELITNAYKYAFVKHKKGQLNIAINKVGDGNYKLEVSDNGSGLDNNFNINKVKSLGLRLVNRLAKQLQGSFSFMNNNGANFEIIFKDVHARKRIN
ncbi:sensor histidine kinase [Winogradskyella immobilis]|uniref:histidine kinase n=1 Tax=Winogradskyella immobilis TaxID=2816852 RepID=A0ABS8EMI3_9FLAO|nr:sensor histidine kinase [Winogradskyella immobilis]MCC1484136.1 sensor histidine kinase [Winogradskyella immobilis]MCG0016228.1 sensor histidine kinase [Winogradskyella immobilis]